MLEKRRLILSGKLVEPPYKIRQESGRVYVNDIQVYPLKPAETVAEVGPPGPKLEEPPDLEFELDEKTERIMKEGLSLVEPLDSFEEKSIKLVGFLKEKGVQAHRDETYGDVMINTGKGWGVVALFNEEARVKQIRESGERIKPSERRYPYDDAVQFSADLRAALDRGDVVAIEQGSLTVIPEEEAEEFLRSIDKA